MSQKVLQISAEDAKYIDPNQIASLTMTDGSVILIQGNQQEEGFVEEAQESDQYTTNQVQQQQQQQPALRGLGTVGKIALGVAGTAAAVGAAAAIGNALTKPRRPMVGGPMMGPGMGMRGPMMGPGMGMRGPMMGPMGRPGMMMGPGFRARKKDETNEEEVCPYCNK